MAQTVTVDSAGSEMALYDAEPDGVARGGVIVLQEAFGITDYVESVCDRLAGEGYRAVAPHLFHRTGDPVIPYEAMRDVIPHLGALSADGLDDDIDATLGHLSGLGLTGGSVGIVGFCMGGSVAMLAASSHALGAAVSFYGGGVATSRFGMPPLLDLAPTLKTPWLGLFGEDDESIPLSQVASLEKAAGRADVSTEVVTFAGAGHAFHTDGRETYREDAASDGWSRTLDWFTSHLAQA